MSELRTRIVRGSVAGGAAKAITIVVGLVMTPYLLQRLGAAQFGLWALALASAAAYGLFDFGLRSAIVKHLAEAMAHRDAREVERIAATCFYFYLALLIVVTLLYLVGARALFALLTVPMEQRRLAFVVFSLALSTAAVSALLAIFAALLDARQRMDITQALGVLCLVLGALGTVALVEVGAGLPGVALAQLLSSVLFFGGCAWCARASLTLGMLSPASISRATAHRLFSYGGRLYVSSACELVNRQFDKFLFARLGGLPLVAGYEVAGRLVGNVGSLQGNLLAPVLPAAATLHAAGERARLRRLYLEASRYSFFLGTPPFFLLVLLTPEVMVAWLGAPNATAQMVLRLLAAGFLVNSLSHAMAATCQGIGRVEVQAAQSAVQLGANVVLSLALVLPLGTAGPPLGTCLALLLGAAYFAWRFHPHVGVSTGQFLARLLAPPLGAATVAALAVVPLLQLVSYEAGGRFEALLRIGWASAVFLAVYLAGCFATGYVSLDELRRIRRTALAEIEEATP